MIHKIVSLRKPIDAGILETGVTGEYELYIQHETGVENLSGLSVEDMVVLHQTIDWFLGGTKADVGLTDDGQSDTMEVEDSEVSDLLSNTVVDEIETLLTLYSDYKTVSQGLHAYVVRQGLLHNDGFTAYRPDSKWYVAAVDITRLNPNISIDSAQEFATTLQSAMTRPVALEVLRNALNHEDEE